MNIRFTVTVVPQLKSLLKKCRLSKRNFSLLSEMNPGIDNNNITGFISEWNFPDKWILLTISKAVSNCWFKQVVFVNSSYQYNDEFYYYL